MLNTSCPAHRGSVIGMGVQWSSHCKVLSSGRSWPGRNALTRPTPAFNLNQWRSQAQHQNVTLNLGRCSFMEICQEWLREQLFFAVTDFLTLFAILLRQFNCFSFIFICSWGIIIKIPRYLLMTWLYPHPLHACVVPGSPDSKNVPLPVILWYMLICIL